MAVIRNTGAVMIDENVGEYSDEFSPENMNEKPSEFNPYDDFLDGMDAASHNESMNAKKNPGDSGLNGRAEKAESEGGGKNSEGADTDGDIELPDFLRTDGTAAGQFEQPAEENSSANDGFKAETGNEGVPEEHGSVQDVDVRKENSGSDNDVPEITSEAASDNQPSGGNTAEKEEEDSSFAKKMSASDAEKDMPKGAKPKVLNKKLLLSSIIIVVGLILIVTFLMPSGTKKKGGNSGKPVAELRARTDYASLAKRKPSESAEKYYEDKNVQNTESQKDDEEIPPVIQKDEKKPYVPGNINYNTGKGAGTTVEIPDTRNDSLHGKTISGIKGLTPSQQSYQTDYQQTVAANTAQGNRRSSSSSYTLPSKDEYVKSVLGAYSQAYGNATGQNNSYAVQNDQAGKNSFYNNGRNGENVGQGEFLNLNTLWQGTIFEATLTSKLNTDLPGDITARIAKNIYSSQDGRFLLIPQNSIVYGTYNSSISYSQNRVQVAWHTLVRPDGYQIQLGSMNGTDAKGASGLKGFVNDHPMAYLKAIGLMSVFSIVNSEFDSALGNTDNPYVQNVMANSQEVTMELADKLIDRAMNVQPTIKIKAGTKINIVVNQNLSLPPCEDIPVTQAYRRR